MKYSVLIVIHFLLILPVGYGQTPMIPADLHDGFKKDSVLVYGELLKEGMGIELRYGGQPFYRVLIQADTSHFWITRIHDSLEASGNLRKTGGAGEKLMPGKYCLVLNTKDGQLIRCMKEQRDAAPKPEIRYTADTMVLQTVATEENCQTVLSIIKVSAFKGMLVDTLAAGDQAAYSLSNFKRAVPYRLNAYQIDGDGAVISDTFSKVVMPNRPGRRDSLKALLRYERQRLINEVNMAGVSPFDSFETPMLSQFVPRDFSGRLSMTHGRFERQVNGHLSNNYVQMQGDFDFELAGLPFNSRLYYFNNGMAEYDRLDFKVSFDYWELLRGLEQAKKDLDDYELRTSFDEARQRATDTSQIMEAIKKKKRGLLRLEAYEQRLKDSLQQLSGRLQDSVRQDSTLVAQRQILETRRKGLEDTLARINAAKMRIESAIALADKAQLNQRLQDSIAQRKVQLEGAVQDSLKRFEYLVEDYNEKRKLISTHERKYRRALELYEKAKNLRSFNVGVVTPDLSPYSVAGIPVNGLHTAYDIGESKVEFVTGKTLRTPLFRSDPWNLISVGGTIDFLGEASITSRLTRFGSPDEVRSIAEVGLERLAYKGWSLSTNFAASFNPYHFTEETEYSVINSGNSLLISNVSKSFGSGNHQFSAGHKYIPAGFQTPGNPFLLNDIHGGELNMTNSFFNHHLISTLRLEVLENNTLSQLEVTTRRLNLLSFQQVKLGERVNFTALNTWFESASPEMSQSLRMHDVSLQFNTELGSKMLLSNLGFFYQEFSGSAVVMNQLAMAKCDAMISGGVGKLGMAMQRSLPWGETPGFTSVKTTLGGRFNEGRVMADISIGANMMQNLNPRLTYSGMLMASLVKGFSASLQFQGNSLMVQGNSFYTTGSLLSFQLSKSF